VEEPIDDEPETLDELQADLDAEAEAQRYGLQTERILALSLAYLRLSRGYSGSDGSSLSETTEGLLAAIRRLARNDCGTSTD
jgi:hypothetical protein